MDPVRQYSCRARAIRTFRSPGCLVTPRRVRLSRANPRFPVTPTISIRSLSAILNFFNFSNSSINLDSASDRLATLGRYIASFPWLAFLGRFVPVHSRFITVELRSYLQHSVPTTDCKYCTATRIPELVEEPSCRSHIGLANRALSSPD